MFQWWNYNWNLTCSCLHDLRDRFYVFLRSDVDENRKVVTNQFALWSLTMHAVLGEAVRFAFRASKWHTQKDGRIIYCYWSTPPSEENSYRSVCTDTWCTDMFLSVCWYKLWMYLMYAVWPMRHLYTSIRTRLQYLDGGWRSNVF